MFLLRWVIYGSRSLLSAQLCFVWETCVLLWLWFLIESVVFPKDALSLGTHLFAAFPLPEFQPPVAFLLFSLINSKAIGRVTPRPSFSGPPMGVAPGPWPWPANSASFKVWRQDSLKLRLSIRRFWNSKKTANFRCLGGQEIHWRFWMERYL